MDWAAISNSTMSSHMVTEEDRCRTREDPVRALGYHTPYTHSPIFPAMLNEALVCCMSNLKSAADAFVLCLRKRCLH